MFRVVRGGRFRVQKFRRCVGSLPWTITMDVTRGLEAKHLFLVATPNFEVAQFWLTAQIVPASPEH